jgi:hypothetical protein
MYVKGYRARSKIFSLWFNNRKVYIQSSFLLRIRGMQIYICNMFFRQIFFVMLYWPYLSSRTNKTFLRLSLYPGIFLTIYSVFEVVKHFILTKEVFKMAVFRVVASSGLVEVYRRSDVIAACIIRVMRRVSSHLYPCANIYQTCFFSNWIPLVAVAALQSFTYMTQVQLHKTVVTLPMVQQFLPWAGNGQLRSTLSVDALYKQPHIDVELCSLSWVNMDGWRNLADMTWLYSPRNKALILVGPTRISPINLLRLHNQVARINTDAACRRRNGC